MGAPARSRCYRGTCRRRTEDSERLNPRKLSDWGLTHRGLVLRRFDGILRDFADFFPESLNPNRLNPNQFAEFCGFFSEFRGILWILAEFCGFFNGILRNFAESLNPNRLNPDRSTCPGGILPLPLPHRGPRRRRRHRLHHVLGLLDGAAADSEL